MTAVEPTMPNAPATGPRSRRDVLCGLLVTLVAPGALVAACAGDDAPGGQTNGQTDGQTGGATSAPGGSAQGVAALADVPDGGGLVIDNPSGGKLLIVRDGDQVKAYNAACTHKGVIVDAPKNGVATCSSHGSQFDTASGAVKKGPATQPLGAVEVKVEGDQVVLA